MATKKTVYTLEDGTKLYSIKDVRALIGNEVKDNKAELTSLGITKSTEVMESSPAEGNYPEVGTVTDTSVLKKIYKKLSDKQLDEWLELEGLTDKVNLCEHAAINRMRKCMTITNLHFPKTPGASKAKKSKYADYTTEQLVQMCADNDLDIKDDKGDMRILRMYSIMTLKKAGVLE